MKPRMAAAVVLSILGLTVALPSASMGAASPMITKVNKVRNAHGLPALRESRSLARSSRRYAGHLMRTDRFGHAYRIHAKGFKHLGEALALRSGWRPGRSATIRGWLRSPAHRALLLSRSFRQVGAGASRGRFGGRKATIWVLHLGRR